MEIEEEQVDPLSANYDTHDLDDSKENKLIKYGYELFTNTPEYIGPKNGKPEMVNSGNFRPLISQRIFGLWFTS